MFMLYINMLYDDDEDDDDDDILKRISFLNLKLL